MCKVNPSNVGMLHNVAYFFLLVAFFSIISGKTYCKRVVERTEETAAYWIIVILYFFLGASIWMGTYLCR